MTWHLGSMPASEGQPGGRPADDAELIRRPSWKRPLPTILQHFNKGTIILGCLGVVLLLIRNDAYDYVFGMPILRNIRLERPGEVERDRAARQVNQTGFELLAEVVLGGTYQSQNRPRV